MKKKINYYFDTDIAQINASNVHVMKMCQAFVRNGWDVTLFCTGDPAAVDLDAVFEAYGVENRFEVKMNKIPELLRRYGHRLGPWYASWEKAHMAAEAGFTYARSLMSMYFVRHRAPYVFEVHAEPDPLNRLFERAILRHKNCRGLVAISQALKDRYLELFPFFPAEKITVLHDAADPDLSGCETKAPLHARDGALQIGYIGSLFPGKCMETLLPLAQKCPQYQFHVVGGAPVWVDHWKAEADKLGIRNVIFYGYVDNSRLGDYYRAFDVCILPFSRDVYINKNKRVNIGRWTSPLKLFEAMAYGKPIIVSGLDTIAEVMEDRVDCVMVEPDNIDEWAEKLTALCADAPLREKIGAAAREKFCRKYTWLERARLAAQIFDADIQ